MKNKRIPATHEYRGKRYGIFEVVPNKRAISIERQRLAKQGVQIAAVDGRKDFGGWLIYARMVK